MKTKLTSLKDYQEVLIRIAELDNLLSVVPPEIENLEQEWKSILARIDELETRKVEQEEQIKEKEHALEEAKVKSQKYEKDLHEVTNNKEYHAVLKEIDMVKKLINSLTDGIESGRTELTEIQANMEECLQLEKESKQKWDEAMSAHQESQSENKAERDAKLKARDALAKKIPERLMKQFRRIAERRNGVGLSVCLSAVCQACNVRVRASVVDQLRRFNRIMSCESCKRILFFSDGD